MFPFADADAHELQAGETYSFTMPADVPVEQFWSLVVYDLARFAFICSPIERAGLSSFDLPNLQTSSDGSVTLYFGPQPPGGREHNWIPTAGKRPLRPCASMAPPTSSGTASGR